MKFRIRAFVIVAVVLAAYASALPNGFVWDDTALVLRDPLIRSWRLIPEGFAHFLFLDATPSDFYRPLQRLLYTFNYWAFAVRPMSYHLTSVLCHAAAALSLWRFARELLERFGVGEKLRERVSFFAAVVWAVHPIHTAAVSYVAGLADPLAAAFGFAGLDFALRSDNRERRRMWIYSAAAAALFLCSALSKESGLLFPFLWLVIVGVQRQWRTLIRVAAVAASTAVIYLSLRIPAEHLPAPRLHDSPPALVRPLLVARAVAEYAALLVFPRHLYMDRDVETHPTGPNEETFNAAAARELETLAGAILFAGLIYSIARAARRDERATLVCLLLIAAAYLPVSGIIVLNATVAEHWMYVPSAFLVLACGLAIGHLLSTHVRWQKPAVLVLTVFTVCLAARTFVRNFDWKDERTFFERTIADGGDSARMLVNLANVEMNDGRFADAHEHLKRALEKEPNLPFALLSSAALAIREKNFAAAKEWLDRAATIPLVEAQAQEMRVVLANHEAGQTDLIRMRLASRTGPPNWLIEKRYIRVLAENGMTAAAIHELRIVLSREPFRAESWQLLGELLQRAGDKADAVKAFAMANDLDVHLALRPPVL